MEQQQTPQEKTLLVDADIVAYIASLHAAPWEVEESIEAAVKFYRDHTGVHDLYMVLSDTSNFRKTMVAETYKAHRKEKPEGYVHAIRYIEEHYPVVRFTDLEADDAMGVMSTEEPGRYVIVSKDKDMRQIPGLLFNPDKWQDGIVEISQAEADYFFWTQCVTGDSTDNYPGIPGAGPKKAAKLLGAPGEKTPEDAWATIEAAYVEYFMVKMSPPEVAIAFAKDFSVTQARLARILRTEDYDWGTGELRLWTPPTYPQRDAEGVATPVETRMAEVPF